MLTRNWVTSPTLAFTSLFALSIGHQAAGQLPYGDGRDSRFDLGAALPAGGQMHELLVGNLTPDGRPDAVVHQGTQWALISAVDSMASHGAALPTGDVIRDVVIVKRPGQDRIVALIDGVAPNTRDLVEYTFRYGTVGAVDQIDRAVVASGSLSPAWNSVQQITAGDMDGDGLQEVVGLGSSKLLRIEEAATAGWVIQPGVAFTGGWTELELVQWGPNAQDSAVLWGPNGVEVVDVTGVVSDAFSQFPGAISSLEAWNVDGGGRLAAIAGTPSSSTLCVRGAGNIAEPDLWLSSLDAMQVAAGDVLGNGRPDLVLLCRSDAAIVALFDLGSPSPVTGRTFNTGIASAAAARFFSVAPALASAMSAQTGRASLSDVDGDGDIDIAFACDATGDLHVLRNGVISEIGLVPKLLKMDSHYDRVVSHSPTSPASTSGDFSEFKGDLSPTFSIDRSLMSVYSHLELTLYQTDLPNEEPVVLSRSWRLSDLLIVDPQHPDRVGVPGDGRFMPDAYYQSEGPSSGTDNANYRASLRYVSVSGNAVTNSGPEVQYEFRHQRVVASPWSSTQIPRDGTPDVPVPVPDTPPIPPRRIPPVPASPPAGN